MERGYLALVLNAHLPFVRRPEFPEFLEERWFFEALSETYLPLLRVFRGLEADGIPFRLSLVVSPTLLSMLGDTLLTKRYLHYLDGQLELAAREERRTAGDPQMYPLACMYRDLYTRDRDDFSTIYNRDIVGAFDYFYKKGRLDLLTTGATHAFLPHYRDFPEAVAAQVESSIIAHRRAFGKHPAGFWLPQLGWYPGLGRILHAYNIQYSVVATRGALLGDRPPKFGSFTPVRSRSGLTLFIRDAGATKEVWSETEGYPADPAYRDFYRDIGFDLQTTAGAEADTPIRARHYTGFKYWAVTGRTEHKEPYNPVRARAQAREHAVRFLQSRMTSAIEAGRLMDRPPLMVCPYDAELFGHWWFEGPEFLDALFRAAAVPPREESAASEPNPATSGGGSRTAGAASLRLVTLGEYHRRYPSNPVSEPEFSSWGEGGYSEVWLDGSNDWVYRHTHQAIQRMSELAERFPDESSLRERILNQGAREVLLSMCSDWSLLMRSGTSSGFAANQVRDAISNFSRIYEMLCANTVATEWITRLEKRNNIFPEMNYRIFRKKR